MLGRLFDIHRFSLDDGPGIRTVVFMKGCNMACVWCHNPESIAFAEQLSKIESLCVRCARCREVCPAAAVCGPEAGFAIDRAKCTVCGACVEACPKDSLRRTGYDIDARELMKTLRKDVDYYAESGGGVTFSGGEPTTQAEFLLEALALCRESGIHTALDTNGCCDDELLTRLSPLVDYVMIDLKHVDGEKHRAFTGESCEAVKHAVRFFAAHNETEARVPVIPGFNGSPDELQAMLDFLGDAGIKRATFLPYHTYGVSKYKSFGMPYRFPDAPPLDAGALEGALNALNHCGVEVRASEK